MERDYIGLMEKYPYGTTPQVATHGVPNPEYFSSTTRAIPIYCKHCEIVLGFKKFRAIDSMRERNEDEEVGINYGMIIGLYMIIGGAIGLKWVFGAFKFI